MRGSSASTTARPSSVRSISSFRRSPGYGIRRIKPRRSRVSSRVVIVPVVTSSRSAMMCGASGSPAPSTVVRICEAEAERFTTVCRRRSISARNRLAVRARFTPASEAERLASGNSASKWAGVRIGSVLPLTSRPSQNDSASPLGDPHLARGRTGLLGCPLEALVGKPSHRPTELLDLECHERHCGVHRVAIQRSIAHPILTPGFLTGTVRLEPTVMVFGRDADHDRRHGVALPGYVAGCLSRLLDMMLLDIK